MSQVFVNDTLGLCYVAIVVNVDFTFANPQWMCSARGREPVKVWIQSSRLFPGTTGQRGRAPLTSPPPHAVVRVAVTVKVKR